MDIITVITGEVWEISLFWYNWNMMFLPPHLLERKNGRKQGGVGWGHSYQHTKLGIGEACAFWRRTSYIVLYNSMVLFPGSNTGVCDLKIKLIILQEWKTFVWQSDKSHFDCIMFDTQVKISVILSSILLFCCSLLIGGENSVFAKIM